jgi:hypothetical protein
MLIKWESIVYCPKDRAFWVGGETVGLQNLVGVGLEPKL